MSRMSKRRPATVAVVSQGGNYSLKNEQSKKSLKVNFSQPLVFGGKRKGSALPVGLTDSEEWGLPVALNELEVYEGTTKMYRDESVQFFANLKLSYTAKMKASRPQTVIPVPNLSQMEANREEEALLNKPVNLPAYSMPNWYPEDDPFFVNHSPLGGKWATEATYKHEMNRVPLRKWESTALGRLMESDDKSVLGTNGIRITVMSYNVLSPRLLDVHKYLYQDNDPQALEWENRCRTFFAEIEHYQPDIIGLQEIDSVLLPLYDQLFEEIGFKGVFKQRTRDKEDGCAIYYRESKFNLIDKLSIEYYQPHVPILDRDNVGLLVKLEAKSGRKCKLVIGTTHLLFNPKRNDVKLAQVQLLLAELDRFSFCGLDKKGDPIYYSTIMTGDFNTEPYSHISRLITEGRLQHIDEYGRAIMPLKRRGVDVFIPEYFGISDQCQHYKVVNARIKCQQVKRTSNFEIETTTSNTLVNVRRSEEYSMEMVHSTASGFKGSSSQFNQSSSRHADSEYSFAAGSSSTVSDYPLVTQTKANLYEHNSSIDSEVLNKIMKNGTLCTFGSGEFSHKLYFRDVHGPKLDRLGNNDALATTKQNGWVCVDYIYYGMVWNDRFGKLIEGKLKLIRRLGLLNRTQCKELGSIPRHDIPSDHFPLVAEFLLKS